MYKRASKLQNGSDICRSLLSEKTKSIIDCEKPIFTIEQMKVLNKRVKTGFSQHKIPAKKKATEEKKKERQSSEGATVNKECAEKQVQEIYKNNIGNIKFLKTKISELEKKISTGDYLIREYQQIIETISNYREIIKGRENKLQIFVEKFKEFIKQE